MPLDPIVEDISSVDESVRGFYKESEYGYVLDVAPKNGFALENVEGLKSALGKERAKAQTYESKLKGFSELGDLDASTIQEKLERLNQLEQLDPTKEADKIAEAKLKSFQEQMASKHQKELGSIQSSAEKYKAQLKNLLIDDAAKSAILSAGGNEKTVAYMLPHLKAKLSLQETENGFMTQVVDQQGNPQIGDSSGNPMTINQLVESMKQEELWAGAFPGRNKNGGGRPSDANGGMPGAKVNKSEMTAREKSAYIAKYGLDAFAKLK